MSISSTISNIGVPKCHDILFSCFSRCLTYVACLLVLLLHTFAYIVFRSVMREFKGVGGLDSIGQAHGEQISGRVAAELEMKLGSEVVKEVSDFPNPQAHFLSS